MNDKERIAERTWPCHKCGLERTKAEGGNTFTLCDNCTEGIFGTEMTEISRLEDYAQELRTKG